MSNKHKKQQQQHTCAGCHISMHVSTTLRQVIEQMCMCAQATRQSNNKHTHSRIRLTVHTALRIIILCKSLFYFTIFSLLCLERFAYALYIICVCV